MISNSDFNTFLENIQNVSALVIGDVMLDRYLYGKVDRISPEAPVPVLNYSHTEEKLGGAGNVALNFKRLGSNVDLIGLIGNDEEGESFSKLLEENSISSKYIYHSEERVTTLKTRAMSGQQHLLRVDREKQQSLNKKESEQLLNIVNDVIEERNTEIVILQDYDKGLFTAEFIESLLPVLRDKNIFVSVDPKVQNFWNYKGVDLLKPNLNELSSAIGREVSPNAKELRKAAIEVESRLYNKSSVFTLSEHGVYIHKNEEDILQPADVRDIVDVCGAGDAVISAVTLSEYVGMPIEFTAELSNIAGRIVCEKIGVVPISLKQIQEKIH